ncbi:integrase [Pelagibacterium halotolerans B2]|uniref:Integrase n=1 Tax=Pelagibacterium halotolerans (strain DSM 22347 / JCM 15775 / CGMCC 1.7692 / B2) TaxID=1082931 RepID=G4RBI4_PELHB|nr:integrase [Pelagibacterium halotolerans B2]
MPAARGAHLYYDKSREQWQIRDSGGYVKRLPRASASCREDAEKALAVHIATRRTSSVPSPVLVQLDEEIASNPKLVSVAQVLAFYGHSKRNDAGNREFIGIHIEHLLGYWGDKVLAQVKRSTCEGYVEWRCAQTWAPPGAKIKKPVSDQTAARELNTLSAAIGVWHREHMLTAVPVVTRPGKRMKTPDWLTEIEYERLTRCAMGDRWVASDVATRQPIWENNKRPQEHLARFIHIAFFQGSRHGGILRQRWSRGDMHGYFDMTTRTCHRSGPGEPKTRKRETACRIHDRLFPMLEEWRQADRKKHRSDRPILCDGCAPCGPRSQGRRWIDARDHADPSYPAAHTGDLDAPGWRSNGRGGLLLGDDGSHGRDHLRPLPRRVSEEGCRIVIGLVRMLRIAPVSVRIDGHDR